MSSYIHDGYTRTDGYVAAGELQPNGERLYDALEFTYRPATRREVLYSDAQIDKICPAGTTDPDLVMKSEDLACEFVSKRMVDWNIKAAGIHPVKPDAAAMGRIHPMLFAKLYRIIRGSITSDPKPPVTEPPMSDEEMQKNSAGVSG